MRIMTCVACDYSRSSEDDGRMFTEDDLEPGKLCCQLCVTRETAISELLVKGEVTIAGFKVTLN